MISKTSTNFSYLVFLDETVFNCFFASGYKINCYQTINMIWAIDP